MARTICTIAILLALCTIGCAPKQQPAPPQKKTFAFWPPAPDEPHIQFLTALNSSKDISEQKQGGFEQMLYGNEPDQVLAIQKPYAVRYWNGRIYTSETRIAPITVLDLRNQQTRIMGATGAGMLKHPVDIAISPEGTKYVVDQADAAIKVFNADERFVTAYYLRGAKLNGACVFGPYLYVTDATGCRVMILDRNYGKVLKVFGERGGLDGQFIHPLAIAADKQGCVYVSDPIRARVQKFGPDGTFLLGFGQHGDRPGDMERPKHLGIGSDGHIHVVDARYSNVQVFDPQGRVVGYYGSLGRHPGAMDFPAGLDLVEKDFELFGKFVHPAFQPQRLILVANQAGPQMINIYAMGQLKEGKTLADLAPQRATIDSGLAAATQPASVPPATAPAIPGPASQPANSLANRP